MITVGGALALLDENGNPRGEIGFERLENIRPDVDTFISLEAIDSESGRSVRSQEVKFTVASTKFTLTSQKATVAVAAGGSATVPVTLNSSGALFFPNVWLTANLGGTPRASQPNSPMPSKVSPVSRQMRQPALSKSRLMAAWPMASIRL